MLQASLTELRTGEGKRVVTKRSANLIQAHLDGVSSGLSLLVNVALDRAQKEFFVDESKAQSQPRAYNNPRNKRKWFVKNKFVNRTGELFKAFSKLVWNQSSRGLEGHTSNSDELKARVTKEQGRISGTLRWSDRSGTILGVSRNNKGNKIAPQEKAFAWARNQFKKLANTELKKYFSLNGNIYK